MGQTWESGQKTPKGGPWMEERAKEPSAPSARSNSPRMMAAKERCEEGMDVEKLRGQERTCVGTTGKVEVTTPGSLGRRMELAVPQG